MAKRICRNDHFFWLFLFYIYLKIQYEKNRHILTVYPYALYLNNPELENSSDTVIYPNFNSFT